jgi:uncharacterized protein (DUF305 family)
VRSPARASGRSSGVLSALVALVLLLSGCGSSSDSRAAVSPPSRTAANGDLFNDADVAFASAMIVHHSESLAIVDLTVGRPLRPKFDRLVTKLRDRRTPEIETMTSWLIAWDEPIPPTIRDHVNAHGGDHSGEETVGSLDRADLRRLKRASDEDFEPQFLALLLAHESDMGDAAETAKQTGIYEPAGELAVYLLGSQRRLIADLGALT